MPGKIQIIVLYSVILLMFLLGVYELKTGDVQNVPFTTRGGSVHHMTALQTIEKKGNDAIKKLRLQKLANGHPFMINSKELEKNQCYLEYPDGTIQLVYLVSASKEFTAIRNLSKAEAKSLRAKYQFLPL